MYIVEDEAEEVDIGEYNEGEYEWYICGEVIGSEWFKVN